MDTVSEHRKLGEAANPHMNLVVQSNSSNSATIPTAEAYSDWLSAFFHFNHALFADKLPDVVITMVRKKSVLGYFRPDSFQRGDGRIAHEIGMNPAYFRLRPIEDALSTLVHEMVHLQRHEFGPRNERGGRGSVGYHDAVWADYMDDVGLTPTVSGKMGDKRTGHKVDHIISPGGPFDMACRDLLSRGFVINWAACLAKPNGTSESGEGTQEKAAGNQGKNKAIKKDRVRFTCSGCRQNAWARPSALFRCGFCDITMMLSPTEL